MGKSYEIKYDPNLKLMIRNTKFLDLYGYNDIPKNIINIGLQLADYTKDCNVLNLMLRDYDNVKINYLNLKYFRLKDNGKTEKLKLENGFSLMEFILKESLKKINPKEMEFGIFLMEIQSKETFHMQLLKMRKENL